MKIRILASAPTGNLQYLTSFLINDTVAVDAGAVGIHGGIAEQDRIRHVFLTHSHADHIATLPILIENNCRREGDSVTVFAHPETLETLQYHVFNGRIWPDLTRIPSPERPFLKLRAVEPEEPVTVHDLRFTPVPVNHPVATLGYIVDDGTSAVAFGADSGPTERIWELAGKQERLKAVFLEAGFPDDMLELANRTGHMTPGLFAREINLIDDRVRVIATNIKPAFRSEVERQLTGMKLPRVDVGGTEQEYCF